MYLEKELLVDTIAVWIQLAFSNVYIDKFQSVSKPLGGSAPLR